MSLKSIEKLADALEVSVSTLLAYGRTDEGAGLFAGDDLVEILCAIRAEEVEAKKANIVNNIQVVNDGVSALHYLFGTDEYASRARTRPRLVLLEADLPKMDGLEVLRRLKADARTSAIPVILIGSTLNANVGAGQRLGAAAFLAKPLTFSNLSQVAAQLNLSWGLLRTPQAEALPEKKSR